MKARTRFYHLATAILIASPSFTLASPPAATVITQVAVRRESQKTIVRIEATGSSNFQMQQLSNPIRFVLDFAGTKAKSANRLVPGGPNLVRTVRVAQFDRDTVRVVIDLDEWVTPVIDPDGHGVTIEFPVNPIESAATAAATEASTPEKAPAGVVQPPLIQAATRVPEPKQVVPAVQSTVNVENGLLSLHANDQLLESILEQISQKADVTVVPTEGVGKERISVDFERYPLGEGLRHLLKKYDVLLFYSGGNDKQPGPLKTVLVYPAAQGPGVERFAGKTWKARNRHLEQARSDTNAEARADAVNSLIRREGRHSLHVVLDALKDPSPKVRHQGLYRALMMGVAVPETTMIDLALSDESSDVRFLALQALPIDPTLRWVAERAALDESQPVSSEAARILRELDAAAGPSAAASTQQP